MSDSKYRRSLESRPDWKRRFTRKYQTDLVIRINEVMDRRELSQKELAERTGWSAPRVSNVLSGTENLTLKTVAKLEEAIGAEILRIPLGEDLPEVGRVTARIPLPGGGEVVKNQEGVWKTTGGMGTSETEFSDMSQQERVYG